ncbi:MAG: hypothetical protein GX130_03230 [Candidatus Hydrogenedens sp.]|jgi:asparagine synthase (glutamine-hydrolysing)|nr:hypothetical protein [Candidatus Hydrogenedens sp.]
MGAIAGYTLSSDPSLLQEMMARQSYRAKGKVSIHSCGNQVMLADFKNSATQEQRYCAVLDGFIANKKHLNRALEEKGYAGSEEEKGILKQAWLEWGLDALLRLEGMFAFALWDEEKQRLWLVRDRAGTKPLYYCQRGDVLYFASTIQALLCCPGIKLDLDPEALDDYLAFLHPLPPRTFYKDIRQVPAGHCACWHEDHLQIQQYWHPLSETEESSDAVDWLESTDSLLSEVVEAYGTTDQRLGTLLSGGLDSTIVSSYLASSRPELPAFTLGFQQAEKKYDERKGARETAALLGMELHEFFIKPHLPTVADTLLQHFHEPFGNPGAVLSEALFREASKAVEVLFSGDGGDEGFGGYPRYKGLLWAEHFKKLPPFFTQRLLPSLVQRLPESTTGSHSIRRLRRFSQGLLLDSASAYALWREQQDYEERHALYSPELSTALQGRRAGEAVSTILEQSDSRDLLTRALYSDVALFLPGNVLAYGDRLSTAHGVELRTPLCEGRLLTHLLQMPSSLKTGLFRDKDLLHQLLRRRLPKKSQPRRKMGLNPPMGLWLKEWLSSPDESASFVRALDRTGLFNAETVEKLVGEHLNQQRDHSWRLWPLLVFSRWHSPGH